MAIKIKVGEREYDPDLLYQFDLSGNEDGLVEFDPVNVKVKLSGDDLVVKAFARYNLDLIDASSNTITVTGSATVQDCEVVLKRHSHLPSYINALQFLCMFYIEAASFIDVADEKWMLYSLHNHKTDEILGFATVYRFFKFPEGIRARISQFMVMPGWKRRGYGALMYSLLMKDLEKDPQVVQVTVESPGDAFQRMKIKCDSRMIDMRLLNDIDRSTAMDYLDVKASSGTLQIQEITMKRIRKRLAREHEEDLPVDDKQRRREILDRLVQDEIDYLRSI